MNHPEIIDFEERIHRAAEALKAAGAREVYLFGSCATETAQADSDVDMAVAGLPPEAFFRAMSEALLILGREFDLVDLDEESNFTRYLKEKHKLVRVA